MKRLVAASVLLALAGCVTAPKPLQGQFSTLLPDAAAKSEATGERIRWGGRIVKVEPQSARSCFEVVGMTLDGSGQPRKLDRSEGRFLACRTGFYDPEVFQAGREITVTGTIEGFETRKVGEFDYRYARVNADTVYLWPERKERDVIIQPGPPWYGYW